MATETLGRLIATAADELSASGLADPRRQARRMVAAALELSQADLFGHPDRVVDNDQVGRVQRMLRRILCNEPLSRILQQREFWGLLFHLSAETLDPRPETETVVEAVLARVCDRSRSWRILDLGTGTGCILLALLSELPAARGIGVDIAAGAVRTAAHNAARLGFADRALFLVGDWGSAVAGRFDVIVANPPYIARADFASLPREVARHDPRRALDGGEDGLDGYRAIIAALPRLLTSDGIFAAELGFGQAATVAGMLEANGLKLVEIAADLAGHARCVLASRGG
ncbi:MAG: peptide chain release factor N(5)-glutamine methyltransferase [Alphaproteobacteria bacterium]|nr:peptide chain release factor N(5)-glutamine methyltransferase [Alphaproteobacteria bacterium]